VANKIYTATIQIRWADSDRLGHVNNAKFIEYAQEARVRFVAELFPEAINFENSLVVRRLEVDFERPLFDHSGPLTVELSVLRIGGASFTVRHRIIDRTGVHAALVDAVVVGFRGSTNTSRQLSTGERAALEPYLATP
jgi:acyl-CoA thioester hydrolase